MRELAVPATGSWSAFNPSIAVSPDLGYACILRSSNYRMDPHGRYLMSGRSIETVNYLCPMDSELNILDATPIIEACPVGDVEYPYVLGMEDARLYWHPKDRLWHALGTVRYHHVSGHCRMADDTIERDATVSRRVICRSRGNEHEKNWAILEGRPWDIVHSWHPPLWRGSSQVIKADGSYLTAVHRVRYVAGHRIYDTMLVKMSGWHPTLVLAVTKPFHLYRQGIEFVAGAAIWKENLVISFGYYDERAMLAVLPLADIQWNTDENAFQPRFIRPGEF